MRIAAWNRTLFTLVTLALCGCDRSAPAPAASQPANGPAAAAGTADIDALRNLPYAGGTEVGEDAENGVVAIHRDRMQRGYTLLSLHHKAQAQLIDESGKVWKTWSDPAGRHWDNVELLPSGDLVTTGADPYPTQGIRDEARYALRLDWKGGVVWKKYLEAHHDIAAAPGDELLTLTFARRTAPELHATVELRDDQITRLRADGELIEHVSIYDATSARPDLYPFIPVGPTTMGGRTWIDLFHCNSVEWMQRPELHERPLFAAGNVLFCSRHQNRIAIIDMTARRLVWAWGRDELDGPHDATVLANGNIMVFDNGLARGWSRVLEVEPESGRIVWQYGAPQSAHNGRQFFHTKSKGSNQRLANGNTLICNADNGELLEVTPAGEVVWHYLSPERIERGQRGPMRAAFVRAYRYDTEVIDELFRRHGEPVPD